MQTPVDRTARRRVLTVCLTQGTVGLVLMAWVTWIRHDIVQVVIGNLAPHAAILIAICTAFALMLALLKFELTDQIYVSLVMTAFTVMLGLLGTVLSAWIAVSVAIAARVLGLKQIGPSKIQSSDVMVEAVKAFGLFGTYGIPVTAAGTLYQVIGGEFPVLHPTVANAARIAVSGVVMSLVNNLLMFRIARTYGYTPHQILNVVATDFGIFLITVPYAVVTALSYSAIGWGAVLALCFTGSVAYFVARNLAITRARGRAQIQRVASLTNIGKTISLRFSTSQLMNTVYTECSKVIDCSLFSIALLDEAANELVFELDIREGTALPKERIPVGEGLNSWVITHHQPLLIASVADESRIGVKSVADSKATESWLGVPMIARDRVIGVISVESYRKGAFQQDDVILLTAIANQAAVAIENAQLYKDLEGLTYALEQRVMERTNELRETNLRLLAADRSKNQFLANMSHELRTPLNSIIGFSSVLMENTRLALGPRLHKFLENIHAAGNHLLELINDILDLSKIEAGKMELRVETFDLHDTVAAVKRVMRGLAAESNVRIHSTFTDSVPQVCLDEGRLKQILFNLLSNAIKFSPNGGPVELAVTFVPRSQSPLSLDAVRIDVADQGVGIAPEDMQRIFDEFYQTEQGLRAGKGGTGLGLSLTRNFVELHHGTIDVHSTPGRGSRFMLYLPVNYNEAAAAPRPVMRSRVPRAAGDASVH